MLKSIQRVTGYPCVIPHFRSFVMPHFCGLLTVRAHTVDASQVAALVAKELTTYRYEAPPSGSSLGTPWPEDKIRAYIQQLRSALVEPHLRTFTLRDTKREIDAPVPLTANYWVVAHSPGYLQFYDPQSDEFGLAVEAAPGQPPVTIGVRGDLVGVFCAM